MITRKTLNLILSVLLVLLTLTSCAGAFGGDSVDDGKKTDGKYKKIVYVDDTLDLVSIRSSVSDLLGILPTVKDTEPASEGEIAFGDTNRAVTAKAKAALEQELSKGSDKDSGYVIYKDGSNVAVYWSIPDMAGIAVEKFISVCVEEKKLVLFDGILCLEGYNSTEFVRDKYWSELSSSADAEVVTSLKTLYHYFDGAKISDFFANLWDGELGGFYYTMGARDNVGYMPDLESTRQILGSLAANGAIADINAAFPTEIKVKIINFAKNMQSVSDGYFYHPQWDQDKSKLQTDRYGRDIGNAIEIISAFMLDTDGDGIEEKQYPNYCAPNGTKCALHTGTADKCSFPIMTASVSSDVSKVSYVKPVASVSSHPDYSSREAFYNWLVAYNATIKEDSGKAHNLSAIRSEITQYGYQDIVLDYLDTIQAEVYDEQLANGEEPTGLWQRNVDYKAVWGFLKYSGYYNAGSCGRAIGEKYFPYIAKTFVKVISLPAEGDYASNDIYNQWDGIARLIDNARRYYGDGLIAEIREILCENASTLIDNTLLKIDDLAVGNGTFALKSDKKSPQKIYGTPISPGIVEGNVNSTNILTAAYRAIFEVLGYKAVPLMSAADGERFIDTICTIGKVEKVTVSSSTVDFDDGEVPVGFKYSTKNSGFGYSVTSDPAESDSALYIESPSSDGGDNIYFAASGTGSSCYLFESDIFVSSDTVTNKTSENIVQIKLGHYSSSKLNDTAYLIILKKNGDMIDIIEASATSSGGTFNTVASVELDQWFRLRVEYYPVIEDDPDSPETPSAKIWVNDDVFYTSEGVYFGSHDSTVEPYFGYDTLNIYTLKSPSIYMYLDNCFFSCENKAFDIDDESITDSRD